MATQMNPTTRMPTGAISLEGTPEPFDSRLFIGGEWRDPKNPKTWPVLNPATEEVIGTVACAGSTDIDSAVLAAWSAFHRGEWGRMDASERGRLLMRVGERIRERAEEIAVGETLDTGKPIRFTRGLDVPLAAEIFTYYGMLAPRLAGDTRGLSTPTVNFVARDPLGVVAILTHFNDPLVSAAARIAPALAAGNAVIHRPAVVTPLSAALLAEILAECGLPEGAYNLLTAEPQHIDLALVRHAGVDKVIFAGDVESGKHILHGAADVLKRVSVELDRTGATLVCADAELEPVVRSAFHGVTYNKGEIGTTGPRLFVEAAVYDELVDRLIAYLRKNPAGDPRDAATVFGPLVSLEQFDAMELFVGEMRGAGAELRFGGAPYRKGEGSGTADRSGNGNGNGNGNGANARRGYFYQPTLFTHDGAQVSPFRRAVYGPLLTVVPFTQTEEAVRRINEGGMAGTVGLHTGDIRRAYALSRMLRTSAVWINPHRQADSVRPFAGARLSGYGREFGLETLEDLTRMRSVWVDMTPPGSGP
jgi:aldehyde dehydrogenase (NAD+)